MTATITKALKAEELLAARLNDYVGEWVAIRDHKVVEHSKTLPRLLAATKDQPIDRLLEVTDDPGDSCFF
jgi:hypothetical protein